MLDCVFVWIAEVWGISCMIILEKAAFRPLSQFDEVRRLCIQHTAATLLSFDHRVNQRCHAVAILATTACRETTKSGPSLHLEAAVNKEGGSIASHNKHHTNTLNNTSNCITVTNSMTMSHGNDNAATTNRRQQRHRQQHDNANHEHTHTPQRCDACGLRFVWFCFCRYHCRQCG